MTRSIRLFSLASLLCTLVLAALPVREAAAAGDPPKPASVRGVVIAKPDADTPPVPVAGAQVVIRRGDQVVQRTTTDEQGRFAFARVAPGASIEIVARKESVGVGGVRIALRPGETQSVRVGLRTRN